MDNQLTKIQIGFAIAVTIVGFAGTVGRKQFRSVVSKVRSRGGPLGEAGKTIIETSSIATMSVDKTVKGEGR